MNNINWNRIGQTLLWVFCLGALIGLMGFIEGKKNEAVCKDVKIYMRGNQYFVERDEIDKILQTGSATLKGRRISNINIQQLEKKLQANPFVEFAKVYMDMDGIINVEVRQRRPILRVINKFGQDFYIDEKGYKLPMSPNFTARVLVANGNIDELFANRVDTMHSVLSRDIYRTAKFIQQDSLWDAQIEELYVNEQKEIEMIPRVGEHRILLGNADSLQSKFDNLYAFYTKAIPRVGWDAYKVINIKFANQVIGIKNEAFWKDSAKTRRPVPAPMMAALQGKAPSTATVQPMEDLYISHAEVKEPESNGSELIMNAPERKEENVLAPVKKAGAVTAAIKKSVSDEIKKEVTKSAEKKEKVTETKKKDESSTKKTPVKSASDKETKKSDKASDKTDSKKATVKKAPEKEIIIQPIILDPTEKKAASAEKEKKETKTKNN